MMTLYWSRDGKPLSNAEGVEVLIRESPADRTIGRTVVLGAQVITMYHVLAPHLNGRPFGTLVQDAAMSVEYEWATETEAQAGHARLVDSVTQAGGDLAQMRLPPGYLYAEKRRR